MAQREIDTPEQVLKFAPKDKAPTEGIRLDEAGRDIVTQIQRAAELANEDCDRAMNLAHKLSMELSASEDRTHQLKVARPSGARRAVASNNTDGD
jgi:hypothetical protein